jgi:hypothetical protein
MLHPFAGQLRSTTFQNLETRKGEKIGQTEVWREAAQIDPERPFLWPSVVTTPHKEVAYQSEAQRIHPVTFRPGASVYFRAGFNSSQMPLLPYGAHRLDW